MDDEGPPRRQRDRPGREPVRVHEIGIARGSARGAGEAAEHERQREGQIRPAAEVAGDPGAVGDPVVAEPRRRDDVDLEAPLPEPLDLGDEEATGDVARVPRVRGRQDDDLQARSLRPKTIGVASASNARAKK
jgi:hypothetical protein